MQNKNAIIAIKYWFSYYFFIGEDEKEKKKRLKEEEKRKKEAEDDTVQSQDPPKEILTPLQEWEVSLMNSTSYAQLFLHLTTLDSSIIWSK